MRKTIKRFLAALALTLCIASVSNAQSNSGGNSVNGNTGGCGDERQGIVISLDNTGHGYIQDQVTGEVFQFKKEGAIVAVIIGDAYTFRLIILPNGRPPIVVDIKPTN